MKYNIFGKHNISLLCIKFMEWLKYILPKKWYTIFSQFVLHKLGYFCYNKFQNKVKTKIYNFLQRNIKSLYQIS